MFCFGGALSIMDSYNLDSNFCQFFFARTRKLINAKSYF